MNGEKQMKDVWTGALTKPSEKTEGKHPTQKPEYLLEKLYWHRRRKDKLSWIRFVALELQE